MDHLIAAAVRAILLADRPAGFPATIPIVIEDATDTLARPHLLIRVDGGENPHPRRFTATLYLELFARSDEQSGEEASGWHTAVCDYFRENPASLYYTLHDAGQKLVYFQPTTTTDELDEPRGRIYSAAWKLILHAL